MQRCAPFGLYLSFLQARITQNELNFQQMQKTLPHSQDSDWLCDLPIRHWGLLPRRKSGRIAKLTSNVSLIQKLTKCEVIPPAPNMPKSASAYIGTGTNSLCILPTVQRLVYNYLRCLCKANANTLLFCIFLFFVCF